MIRLSTRLLILLCLFGPIGQLRADEDDGVGSVDREPRGKAQAGVGDYFSGIREELQKTWPNNRNVRFVFHGHSVPAGYFKTPIVQRFDSYPSLFHQRLCQIYRTAVIDVCVTAIGGENSERGAARFKSDVLSLKPEMVFIDYCLNDRGIGLKRAAVAWRTMIRQCLEAGVKPVLLTPTPDSREDLLDVNAPLMQHSRQVRQLAEEFEVPVVDSYATFRQLVSGGAELENYLSQTNHPNRSGHLVVTELLVAAFTGAETGKRSEP